MPTDTTKERLENLAAINYNLYLGSPANRRDIGQEWTYQNAVDEILAFIEEEKKLALEEERKTLWGKIKRLRVPEVDDHTEGYNDGLELAAKLVEGKE